MDSKEFQTIVISKLDKLEDRVDGLTVVLAKQQVVLEKNTESLIEHVKRTNLLEAKIEAVEHHVTRVETITKAVGKLAVVGSVVVSAVWAVLTFMLK